MTTQPGHYFPAKIRFIISKSISSGTVNTASTTYGIDNVEVNAINIDSVANADLEIPKLPFDISYSNHLLTINNLTSSVYSVEILDLQGKILRQIKANGNQSSIETTSFENQTVVFVFESDGKIWTKKISL
jgi:hypothetical protein